MPTRADGEDKERSGGSAERETTVRLRQANALSYLERGKQRRKRQTVTSDGHHERRHIAGLPHNCPTNDLIPRGVPGEIGRPRDWRIPDKGEVRSS